MIKYIAQRVLALLITLFIILTIAFLVIRLMPGSIYDSNEMLSADMVKILEDKYHLNDPLLVQYRYFLEDILLRWDWGTSVAVQPRVPVWEVLASKIPITLQLNFISLLISLPIGILATKLAWNTASCVSLHTPAGVKVLTRIPFFPQ